MSETTDNKLNMAETSPQSMEEISIYDVINQRKRRIILFWISYTVFLGLLGQNMYIPAIARIAIDLHTSNSLITLSVALFILMTGLSSLIWGSAADRWGRNLPMRIGCVIFTISCFVCIFANNIVLFLVMRSIQGAGIAVALVVGQAIVGDIYRPQERGLPTGIFIGSVFLGVLIAPIIGSLIAHFAGWRYIFVFLTVFSGVGIVIYFFVVPETLQYQLMKSAKDKVIREKNEITEPSLTNPCLPLRFMFDKNIFPHVLAASTAFGSVLLNQTLLATVLTSKPYLWNELQIGLITIPGSIGEIIGCILGGWLSDKGSTIFKLNLHEARLLPATALFVSIPIGLLIYGWNFQFSGRAYISIIGSVLTAIGEAIYRPAIYSYLTVTNQQAAASVSATNSSLNFVIAAIFISIAIPIDQLIGIGSFFTIIAVIILIAISWATIIIVMKLRSSKHSYQSF